VCWPPDKPLSLSLSLSLSRSFCSISFSLSSPYRAQRAGVNLTAGGFSADWQKRTCTGTYIHTVRVSYLCPKQEVRLIQEYGVVGLWYRYSQILFFLWYHIFFTNPFYRIFFLPGTSIYGVTESWWAGWVIYLSGGAIFSCEVEKKPAIGRDAPPQGNSTVPQLIILRHPLLLVHTWFWGWLAFRGFGYLWLYIIMGKKKRVLFLFYPSRHLLFDFCLIFFFSFFSFFCFVSA